MRIGGFFGRRVLPAALLLAIAAAAGCGRSASPAQGSGDRFAAVFAAYEKGDLTAALAALPPALRDASPYGAADLGKPPFERDAPLYARLSARFEAARPASPDEIAEAAVHYALGVLAYEKGDDEAARRRLLLAVLKQPRFRMAHVYLARVYGRLESAALADLKAGESEAAVLAAEVGAGSSDQHVDMAQAILDDLGPAEIPALVAAFKIDGGTIRDFKVEWTSASGNARIQRPAVRIEPGSCRLELRDGAGSVLDEKTFPSVQIVFWDGKDAQGRPVGGKDIQTAFDVSLELLSPMPGARLVVFDSTGRAVFSAPVPGRPDRRG